METLGYDPFMPADRVRELGCVYYEHFEEMLKDCDFVSLHLPLNEGTRNMISMKQLKMMKPSAAVINCARGGIVNEADLAAALDTGIIAAAATDVFENEPPDRDDPLLTAKNLIYSPHSAAQTREAVVRMHTMCVEGCLAIVNGERWPYVANPEAYDHPRWNNQ
jgi:D-3-phosphoglycerate dehydrogenase